MTNSAQAPAAGTVDPAIVLADALQSGFAAQRSACQRARTAAPAPGR